MMADWDWNNTWGWDYPMMAMTAARLGEGETAIQALLMDEGKNHYLANGHNPQMGPTLPLYLPGNGGLLYAAAMMAASWDGAPAGKHAPGFPDNGENGWWNGKDSSQHLEIDEDFSCRAVEWLIRNLPKLACWANS